MESQDLARLVGETFCESGAWPIYVDIDLRLIDEGGIEPLLADLGPEVLTVAGTDEYAELWLATPESYREYAPCGDIDLERVGACVNLFAEAAQDIKEGSLEEGARIEARELQEQLQLSDLELSRLVQVLNRFASSLHSGGTRGDDHSAWSFSVSSRAIYFEGIDRFDEFQEREAARMRTEEQRRERESRARAKQRSMIPVAEVQRLFSRTSSPPEVFEVQLHPAVHNTSADLYGDGYFAEAVQRAAQRFEAYLQDIVADYHVYGLPLVGKALGGDSPKIALNPLETKRDEAEQRGYLLLAKGVVSAFRNVQSHGHPEEMDGNEALEQLAAISGVWRRVEAALKESESRDRDQVN